MTKYPKDFTPLQKEQYDTMFFQVLEIKKPDLRDIGDKEVLAVERARIMETLYGMKNLLTTCCHTPNDSCDSDCASQEEVRIYNQVLDKLIKKIKKLIDMN